MFKRDIRGLNVPMIAAAVILVVGVGAAIWSLRGLQSAKAPRTPPLPALASSYVWSDAPVSVKEHGAEEVARQIRESLAHQVQIDGLPNRQSLLDDAHDIVLAWFGGTGDDYMAYLAERGLEPPPAPRWKNPEQTNESWKRSAGYFGEVSIDPLGIQIVTRFENGRPVTPRRPRMSSSGWRYDKLSMFDENLLEEEVEQRAKLTLNEVVIPIRMSDSDGSPFEGEIVLGYAWDTGNRSWVLIRVSICDYPNGSAVTIPPF